MLKKHATAEESEDVNMTIESVSRVAGGPPEAARAEPKPARINFSVAALLADTRPSARTADMLRYHRATPGSPLRQTPDAQPPLPGRTPTPPLDLNAAAPSTSSDDDDEDSLNHEDSIVDVEELQQVEDEPGGGGGRCEKFGPVRPMPFSALAAAAVYHGVPWPGPVVPPFSPNPLFQSHFPVGPMAGETGAVHAHVLAPPFLTIHRIDYWQLTKVWISLKYRSERGSLQPFCSFRFSLRCCNSGQLLVGIKS
ncbi:hypothetical protein EVAR_67684_1 [Eumeta japonica]|uniref:Uncharacterized protein n=1 Tax=Eumeta variegata TaxID=151549 RepID=A0A4C1ZMH4_EUMVA|nr:hypothetical protein EVAR_67684_1 [Eumeta japonica]